MKIHERGVHTSIDEILFKVIEENTAVRPGESFFENFKMFPSVL
jgi:hypothetical protein